MEPCPFRRKHGYIFGFTAKRRCHSVLTLAWLPIQSSPISMCIFDLRLYTRATPTIIHQQCRGGTDGDGSGRDTGSHPRYLWPSPAGCASRLTFKLERHTRMSSVGQRTGRRWPWLPVGVSATTTLWGTSHMVHELVGWLFVCDRRGEHIY